MSDVNLDVSVNEYPVNITVAPNDITFTPTDIQLTVYAGAPGYPGGAVGQLQYNNNGVLGGITGTSFTGGNLDLGSISNVKITGGSAFNLIQTDGAGNLSFVTQGDYVNANVANVHIYGGVNGYVLQTDGAGNLSWTAQTGGGGGNGSPGGANTQIQYNDSGSFGGNAGFTFNEITGNVNIPGGLTVAGDITGTTIIGNVAVANTANYANVVVNSSQPNITSVGTLTSLTTSGLSNLANLQLNYWEEKLYDIGNASGVLSPNFLNGSIQSVTLTGNITLNNLTNAIAGRSMTLIINQDSTGGRTMASTMKFAGGANTLSTGINSTDILFIFYTGTQYYCSLTKGYI